MYAVADKPFVCDVCGQSYKYQMILAENMKRFIQVQRLMNVIFVIELLLKIIA